MAPTTGVVFRPQLPPEDLRTVVTHAEAAGVAELWLWEDCFLEGGLTTAAAALAWSDRLVVGVGRERRAPDGRALPLPGGYDRRDAVASLSMGVVSIMTMTLWKAAALVLYAALFAWVAPWQLPVDAWWTWALAILGFSVSLVYQFFVHTERVGRLWRPLELVLNTPSHHRVHHGSDPEYLDRNYGGILIVWDRLFGSFQPELHRPTYGLTTPVGIYHVVRLQTHEYAAIIRDLRRTPGLRDKLGYVFGPPGWRPEAASATRGDHTPAPVA